MPHPNQLAALSKPLVQRIEEIMDWIPVIFIAFKFLVLGTAMFFSIKSHRDKQKEEQEEERERQKRVNATDRASPRGCLVTDVHDGRLDRA